MEYTIQISEQGRADYFRILEYLADVFENQTAVSNLVRGNRRCLEALRTSPYLYEACREPRLAERGYRKAVIRNYIMVYRVDEDARTVHILRYFHGYQDYEALL